MVFKFHRGELQQNLVLRVQDTGGQPMFVQVLDLLSCPGGSVYLVVFSLSRMRDHFPHCVGEVIGSIESIHAFASGAPLVLVGTRRGYLSEEALAELSDRVKRERERESCDFGAGPRSLISSPTLQLTRGSSPSRTRVAFKVTNPFGTLSGP